MEIKKLLRELTLFSNNECGANEYDVKAIVIDGDKVLINPKQKFQPTESMKPIKVKSVKAKKSK